jgi:hypothetical protein
MPRVLEQSYISHYKPELNGNISKNVIFNLGIDNDSAVSAENVDYKDNSRINIYRALYKNKNILAYSYSMNGLASILNISLAGLKYHLGRDSYIYIKSINAYVSITKEGLINAGKPKDFYRSKKVFRDNLELTNISLSSLEKGYIYAFNLDKETIFTKGVSSPALFKLINPNLYSKLEGKSLKSKSDNLSTYINKDLVYSSELGKFYLAKNPNYAINAKQPLILIDLHSKIATYSTSKRECARYLTELLNINIQTSTMDRYK